MDIEELNTFRSYTKFIRETCLKASYSKKRTVTCELPFIPRLCNKINSHPYLSGKTTAKQLCNEFIDHLKSHPDFLRKTSKIKMIGKNNYLRLDW